ncbi:MAG TPA: cytochrome c-type biogenesis protein CcmH [Ktedonobacteraceae bacterium]|nr:cytochrome c-type biogenesis protein CcmH [Ktedonobacteraceae bacterium]
MKQKRPLLIVLAVVAIVAATWSYVLLQNPPQQTLDQRVQQVAAQLKCPVCQGESVADSPSLISQQMRGVIRQQLQSGKSEQEVIAYFQARYGDQIVWSPPWQGFSLLAWLVPIALLLGGLLLMAFVLRDWRSVPSSETSSHDAELTNIDEADLAGLRALLEQELAADDPIFARHTGTEAS